MNLVPFRNAARKVGSFVAQGVEKMKAAALAIVGVGAGLVATANEALAAPTTLTGAATGKLTSAESDITSILIILVGVVFLFVLYSLIKKAK